MERLQTSFLQAKSSSDPMIRVSHLTKRFVKGSEMAAVNDISFEVGEKEIATLLGPSGCGKTTTLRCIAGLEEPDKGEIMIGGTEVTSMEKGVFVPPEKRNIGLVFQSYALWPHMKVFDNVAYGLRMKHVPKQEIESRVKKVLEIVDLAGYEDRYPAQLSGGQQQRVALARSVVYEPKVLLLDEPLSNLDAKIRERTRIELRNLLKKVGITSVYVTHDQEEAFQISDRVIIMNQGSVMQVGTPYDIYHSPEDEFVASFVCRSNLVDGTVTAIGEATGDDIVKGTIRVFDDYDIECSIPRGLKTGDKCWVLIRANEVGLYSDRPSDAIAKKCTVINRAYKGSMTDHLVKVDDVSLLVSTHRFCGLSDVDSSAPRAERITEEARYIVVRGDSVSIIPKTRRRISTESPGAEIKG